MRMHVQNKKMNEGICVLYIMSNQPTINMTCSTPRVQLVRKWQNAITQAAIMELENDIVECNNIKQNVIVAIITLHLRGVSKDALSPYFKELSNQDEHIDRTNLELDKLRSELEHTDDDI